MMSGQPTLINITLAKRFSRWTRRTQFDRLMVWFEISLQFRGMCQDSQLSRRDFAGLLLLAAAAAVFEQTLCLERGPAPEERR